MEEVARFYARVLLHDEAPEAVKRDVAEMKAERQVIRYCFNDEGRSGYPE